MPIYQIKNVSEHLKVGIWKIEETEKELTVLLLKKVSSLAEKPNTSNQTRIKQWLATRLLLSEFFENAQISYDKYGKPHLDNGCFISISHSNEFVAIAINQNNHCGIDIEKITPKVERIKQKFLNVIDLENVIEIEDLTIYWSAKEALYKYYGRKEILFIEHLFIENFTRNKASFIGKIDISSFNTKLGMVYEKIEDYILVYTL